MHQTWPEFCKQRNVTHPLVTMLNWTFTFFILAVISGILGFTSLAGSAVGVSQTLFALFVGLMIVSLVNEERRRNL